MKTFIFSLFILLPGLVLGAEEFVARVTKLRGEIKVEEPSGKIRLIDSVGERLFEGEKVLTGERSFVKILMKDDTVFHVGPKSEFGISKFKMRDKNDRDAIYEMTKGKFRSIFVNKAKKQSSLLIKTPSVSMAVRGTEILTDVYKLSSGAMKTDVALVEGKLDVKVNNSFGDKVYSLLPRDILQVSSLKNDVLSRDFGKINKDVFDKLKNIKKAGSETFLHDALKKNDPDFYKGKKPNFDYTSSVERKSKGRSIASVNSVDERIYKKVGEKDYSEIDSVRPYKVSQPSFVGIKLPDVNVVNAQKSKRVIKKSVQNNVEKARDKLKKIQNIKNTISARTISSVANPHRNDISDKLIDKVRTKVNDQFKRNRFRMWCDRYPVRCRIYLNEQGISN